MQCVTSDRYLHPDLIKQRKEQGCLAVDMECSASLAVAKFRNIPIVQFLFGADNLDAAAWEPRDIADYGFREANRYILMGLEMAVEMKRQP